MYSFANIFAKLHINDYICIINRQIDMLEKDQKELYIELGNRIRIARERKGVSQSIFASMLGLSRSSIVNIEKGRQRPSVHLLYEISQNINTELTELLTGLLQERDSSNQFKLKETISNSLSNIESINKIADFINDELE